MNQPDQTTAIVRDNLAKIKLVSIAGPLLSNDSSRARVVQLLQNRRDWGNEPPVVMLAVHDEEEAGVADWFQGEAADLGDFVIQPQEGHNKTVGNAVSLFQNKLGPHVDVFSAKRESLHLKRQGGQGHPKFISPFTEGQGTTCGEWTRVVAKDKDGKGVKGFMKGGVAVGFCPVGCPHCYLNMYRTDAMTVALNLEDLADELQEKWSEFQYPINFGETSGLVEYDEWFSAADGQGSIVQFVIDASAEAGVTPYFLTKIRFPPYLRFSGRVQVGISLMPEPLRQRFAPHGSPSDELLDSLAWSVSQGAQHPVVRMTTLWQEWDRYPALLAQCRDRLGSKDWRLTVDILRFTPSTARTIGKRYPEAAAVFAREISPEGNATLGELAKQSTKGTKKLRPPIETQADIYGKIREELDRLGCSEVPVTACKGNPEELLPLVRSKVIRMMPCACYAPRS